MKTDTSRSTFDRTKHYSSVRMQQGRVQLDSDWNEQSDVAQHRVETEARDTLGGCAGPIHAAAFRIVAAAADLSPEEAAQPENATPPSVSQGDFLITGGRFYAGGILCENDRIVPYTQQPDLLDLPPVANAGFYIAYLDVWRRAITTVEDPAIREVALGGPDTASRAKTVWQVRLWPVPSGGAADCLSEFTAFTDLLKPGDGTLRAQTSAAAGDQGPCVVPPGSGYRGLENQHYRVEIHDPGQAFDVTSGAAGILVTQIVSANEIEVDGILVAGGAVEIYPSKANSDSMAGVLAYVTAFDGPSKRATLNTGIGGLTMADAPRVRTVEATFKWSRENGSVVTPVLAIDGKEVAVLDLGRDEVLGFAPGNWVELIDDAAELDGRPGQLAVIAGIDESRRVITLATEPAKLSTSSSGVDPARHPKLRRWEGVGAVKFHPPAPREDALDLEAGIQITFSNGRYLTASYWNIPARTATADGAFGNIIWPDDNTNRRALLPFGIAHHYCRLAVLQFDGTQFTNITDCRPLFPPITELTTLLYVGGDGQEAMPGNPLPQPVRVGVFNGRWPIAGVAVRFVADPNGRVADTSAGLGAATNEVRVVTGTDGLAAAFWLLDSDTAKLSQQLEARMLDAAASPTDRFIRFGANLSVASNVAYDPGKCSDLANVRNVQDALDTLCARKGAGGGCQVTVGKGGMFERLDEAVQSTLKDTGGACICLLPGVHDVAGFEIVPPSDAPNPGVCIHGRGDAILVIHEKPLVVGPLNSFIFDELAVRINPVKGIPIQFRDCRRIEIRSSQITSLSGLAGLIAISNAVGGVVIKDSSLSSTWFDPTSVKSIANLRMVELFDPVRFAPAQSIVQLAQLLSNDAQSRSEFASKYKAFLANPDLPQEQAQNAQRALEVIADPTRVLLKDPLDFQRLTTLLYGNALLIADNRGDVLLDNCEIFGVLHLYGASLGMPDAKWRDLGNSVTKPATVVGPGRNALDIRNTLLLRIEVDQGLPLGSGAAPVIQDAFERSSLTDCRIAPNNSQLVSRRMFLTANQFNYGSEQVGIPQGVFIANDALAFGNYGPPADNSGLVIDVPDAAAHFRGAGMNLLLISTP